MTSASKRLLIVLGVGVVILVLLAWHSRAERYLFLAYVGCAVILTLVAILVFTPVPQGGTRPTTFAEVFYVLIAEQIHRTLLFLSILVVTCWILIFISPSIFKKDVIVELNNAGIKISSGLQKTAYLQFVHPFGWQPTVVHLKAGQRMKVSTSGKITVGFTEYYWDLLSRRMIGTPAHAGIPNKCLSLETLQGSSHVRFNPPGENGCSIRGLTDDQMIKLKWEWTGPEGYVSSSDATFLAKYKGATYGRLVGHIANEDIPPNRQIQNEAVLDIGNDAEFTANRDGRLYLAVNDSLFSLKDNLGYFIVTLERD